LGDDKNAVLMHFGVKKPNSTKMDLRGLWYERQNGYTPGAQPGFC